MSGLPFAGRYRVKRSGAILYFALEGAGRLAARLSAAAKHRGIDEQLPFAWRTECPALTDEDAGNAPHAKFHKQKKVRAASDPDRHGAW
jgi:hypothetical protein